jgi:hypothetical protein
VVEHKVARIPLSIWPPQLSGQCLDGCISAQDPVPLSALSAKRARGVIPVEQL